MQATTSRFSCKVVTFYQNKMCVWCCECDSVFMRTMTNICADKIIDLLTDFKKHRKKLHNINNITCGTMPRDVPYKVNLFTFCIFFIKEKNVHFMTAMRCNVIRNGSTWCNRTIFLCEKVNTFFSSSEVTVMSLTLTRCCCCSCEHHKECCVEQLS